MMTPVGAPTRMGRDVPSRSPAATPGQPGPCGRGCRSSHGMVGGGLSPHRAPEVAAPAPGPSWDTSSEQQTRASPTARNPRLRATEGQAPSWHRAPRGVPAGPRRALNGRAHRPEPERAACPRWASPWGVSSCSLRRWEQSAYVMMTEVIYKARPLSPEGTLRIVKR